MRSTITYQPVRPNRDQLARPHRSIVVRPAAESLAFNSGRIVPAPLDEDVARLSPFARDHLNVVGNYTFALPDLGDAGFRPLRDPDAADDEMTD